MGSNDDRTILRTEAYADPSKLQARQALWSYADRLWETSRITWAVELGGDEVVVDVGCGNGNDLRGLRTDGHRGPLVGVDFSPGMLAAIPQAVAACVVGDAQALPLRDDIADVVCAMHMLYHVPDIPLALREARRVLHGAGAFLASTNSEDAARELVEPWSAAMVAAGGPPLERASHFAFSVERGAEILSEVFVSVELKQIEITARVPSADVIRNYVASTDDLYRPLLPTDEAWRQVLDTVHEHAEGVIARNRTFDITQRAGVFVCRS